MIQPDLHMLREQLATAAEHFVVDAQPSDQCWHVRFEGRFEEQPVVWYAQIETLAHFAQRSGSQRVRQFIDIQLEAERHQVQIGLNLPRIDNAGVMRTIIMIRKYKRLHAGRHEYGEWIDF
jgi:hypothetical protein